MAWSGEPSPRSYPACLLPAACVSAHYVQSTLFVLPLSQPAQLKQPWRGGPPKPKADPTQRVRGGALDYKSGERLQTLGMLRTVASVSEAELAMATDISDSMQLVAIGGHMSGGGGGVSARGSRSSERGITEIEKLARSRRSHQDPGLDWASWEARWAEHLKSLAAAAGRAKREAEARERERAEEAAFGASSADRYEYECDDDQKREPPPPRWSSSQRAAPPRTRQYSQQQQQEQERAREREQQQQQRRRQQQQQQEQQQQERRRQEQPPPRRPSSSSSSRAPLRSAPPVKMGRFFESWSKFDAAFVAWEAQASQADKIRLADIPFPPSRDPAGLAEAGLARASGSEAGGQRKKLLRKALLRWHPDKWMAVTQKIDPEEHSQLGERLSAITQALVEQKDK